jgi:cyclophilin family peptidyl-prolyl cis-trans isomerase
MLAALLACAGEAKKDAAGAAAETATPSATPASGASAAAGASLMAGPASPAVQAPDSFRVVFETNKGNFTVSVTRSLAPHGADRFYELVNVGYFSDVRFFRVLPGFVAQFGMHGDPNVNKVWESAALQDEPRKISNTPGTVVFATAGPNTRSNQFFVNMGDNTMPLDGMGFAPFGHVVEGMDVIGKLNTEYGEEPSQAQPRIAAQGNEYLAKWFPALDYIKSAKIAGK